MASWREIFAGLALLAGANAQNAPRFEPPDPTVRDGDVVKFWVCTVKKLIILTFNENFAKNSPNQWHFPYFG